MGGGDRREVESTYELKWKMQKHVLDERVDKIDITLIWGNKT